MTAAPHPSDLTGRARIRNTALRQFAERGFAATTMRDVATAAGVSPALVQHHFGTKDGLREACDSYALAAYIDIAERSVMRGELPDRHQIAQEASWLVRYLALALVEDSPAATAIFDALVAATEDYLRTREGGTTDLHARAVVLTAMRLGVTVLHRHVGHALDTDVFSEEGVARVNLASLDLLAPGLVDTDLAESWRADLSEVPRRSEPPGAPGEAARSTPRSTQEVRSEDD
ncbi:TetR/AcrR family transcriptional regulator [Nocardiopsis xinjiangensis]|uniref:TetR/AcrR family transcriptional regulator n=1 Tax=Nocardiopsis xinjiangensis TaxID=124285 RepID=UPI000363B6E4|nr:TetR/AcrR family transcriptional regulator [Nocardiopsis xinjiangensis]